jgi:hypothetical protein
MPRPVPNFANDSATSGDSQAAAPEFSALLAANYASPTAIARELADLGPEISLDQNDLAPLCSSSPTGSECCSNDVEFASPASARSSQQSSEEIDWSEGEECSCPCAPKKKKRNSGEKVSARRDYCHNRKVLGLKCSEAFALVERWEGIGESSARYKDTFYPLVVLFARSARENASPLPFSDRLEGYNLRDRLDKITVGEAPNCALEWMPDGDEPVGTVLDKACSEAYADAGRVGQLSELYVRNAVSRVARKLIGCCVRLNRDGTRRLTEETVRLKVLLALVIARVEEDESYLRDCENHKNQTRRVLNFDDY